MAKGPKTLKQNSARTGGTKKSSSPKKEMPTLDVKTLKDVAKLVQNIKNNVVTLLLIYADWCGHCTTFKTDIWKKLAKVKGRKIPMAQINEKVLSHLIAEVPNLKADGYPTVSLIGRDMKAAELKDPNTGETTNSLPNTRDMASMTKLITANPSQVVAENGLGDSVEDLEEEEHKSATPTAESLVARKNAGKNAIENINNGTPNIKVDTTTPENPPNVEDDLVESQEPRSQEKEKPAVGGSLYASLVAAASRLAVPIGLTAAASFTKRKSRGAGTKRRK
jgi:hypothetical protein